MTSASAENVRYQAIAKRYELFAEFEARGVSPLYEEITLNIAGNDKVMSHLATLPTHKQQPNLLLACYRKLLGTAPNGRSFCEQFLVHYEQIMKLMLSHSTQTNEPARCATLLPLLANLPQPLALLEVGAAAGLCLFPDKYGYQFGERIVNPNHKSATVAPVFRCQVSDKTPIPDTQIEVAWRRGIDLSPLDLMNEEHAEWLRTLVWPEQVERRENLDRAIDVVRESPPTIVKGNLLDCLEPLAQQAPKHATLVVFHSAVLAYVQNESDKAEFRSRVSKLDAVWISNEHPAVFPDMAAQLRQPPPNNRFMLCMNGAPVAVTGPHGQSIDWLVDEAKK